MRNVARNALGLVYMNLLDPDLFRADISVERARALFLEYCGGVEIENHNYCNRACWFCPNAQIDRRSNVTLMQESLFAKIIDDLASVDWHRKLSWSRYHEAFADESIFDRLKTARAALPRAALVVFSNGDYLDKDKIRRLEECGLDVLVLSLYPPDGREGELATVDSVVRRFTKRTGLELVRVDPYRHAVVGAKFKSVVRVRNFHREKMTSRAGAVETRTQEVSARRHLCVHPLRGMVIDYNGKATICCETLSDLPAHADTVVGDVGKPDYGLFHLYRDLAPFRANLLSVEAKKGVCATCTAAPFLPAAMGRRPVLASIFRRVPGLYGAFARRQARHLDALSYSEGEFH
ncbi:MAG: radical SAM protein [Alphaproteobacteria bacterium]